MIRRFVITGCARSGTGYMASLLTELGHPCGHETVFAPGVDRFTGFGSDDGESSWLAAPFLDQLPPGTVVVHQVRRPDEVVRSMVGIGFFDTEGTRTGRDARALLQVLRSRRPADLLAAARSRVSRGRRLRRDFVEFTRRHCPEAFVEEGEAARAARYWISWNQLTERGERLAHLVYRRYRVEDVDAATVAELVELIGGRPDPARIDAALAAVPPTTNTRPPQGGAKPDDGLPPALAGEMTELAHRYGYRL